MNSPVEQSETLRTIMLQEPSRVDDVVIKTRRCVSTGPVWHGISQSLIMNEMRERLSGYDYKCDIESRVSECSFDSFKHYRQQAYGEAAMEEEELASSKVIINKQVDQGSFFYKR